MAAVAILEKKKNENSYYSLVISLAPLLVFTSIYYAVQKIPARVLLSIHSKFALHIAPLGRAIVGHPLYIQSIPLAS